MKKKLSFGTNTKHVIFLILCISVVFAGEFIDIEPQITQKPKEV